MSLGFVASFWPPATLSTAKSTFVSFVPSTSFLARRQSVLMPQQPSAQTKSVNASEKKMDQATVKMALVSPQLARTLVLVYSIIMAGGGLFAFIRTKSTASIVSGLVSAAVLLYAYQKNKIPVALVTAIGLSIVFAIRFVKTKKLMPAGMLGMISLVFAALFAAAIQGI